MVIVQHLLGVRAGCGGLVSLRRRPAGLRLLGTIIDSDCQDILDAYSMLYLVLDFFIQVCSLFNTYVTYLNTNRHICVLR